MLEHRIIKTIIALCFIAFARWDGVRASVDAPEYDFINMQQNHIINNGMNLDDLGRKLQASDMKPFRVVHIGDSHIQAGIATSEIRRMLQERFGSGGRGLIAPLRQAGTNQPPDYEFIFNVECDCEKVMGHEWKIPVGFSGVSVSPVDTVFVMTVRSNEAFETIHIHHIGGDVEIADLKADGVPTGITYDTFENIVSIYLPSPCEEAQIGLRGTKPLIITGAELQSDEVGVTYNVIGVNGANFESFERIGGFCKSIASLEPDLIVVSLGTNDAFGAWNRDELYSRIDAFISDLTNCNPEAVILLTTPSECYRRIGRRRSSKYAVNSNVGRVREVIMEYAAANLLPVYDWYAVAGGAGASAKWLKHGLLSRDRVHLTQAGYTLFGQLFEQALIDSLIGSDAMQQYEND